jgi:quinol monooxygenase YgiN
MTYVVAANWRAKEGEEAEVRRVLATVAPLVRAEPACRAFITHASTEDPRAFFIYEQYDDEAGFQAHLATEHFERLVLGEAVPRLETRTRSLYVTME